MEVKKLERDVNYRILKKHNLLLKRAIDLVVSTFVLTTIFPIVFIVVAPLIKLSSKGPVFFTQERHGKNKRKFVCYKFRTMIVTPREIADQLQATKNDPRVTPVGLFLRKTGLDELPQFINVFKGDMSIVGPRPHPIPLDEKFENLIEGYEKRFLVKPGITGWAQVNGWRGETPTVDIMRKRVEHDIWYIENWSVWLDIKIMLKTVFSMLGMDPKAY